MIEAVAVTDSPEDHLRAAVVQLEGLNESLKSRLAAREDEVAQTRKKVDKLRRMLNDLAVEHNDEDIREVLVAIGNVFGIELTRDVDIEFTTVWRGTVTIPIGVNIDGINFEDCVSFYIESSGSQYDFDLECESVDYTFHD